MSTKNRKITVKGQAISVVSGREEEYISLTDIARYKDSERTDSIIQNWLRIRNTIEFLGIWEQLNNADFNPIEFDGIRNQAGLNRFVLTAKRWIGALFGKTALEWRSATPDHKGNIRAEANALQLVCLANLEALNAHLIQQGLGRGSG